MTTRTDRRLYESDGNATIRTLGQSTPFFFATCKELYEKMLNTVPKEVQLSPVVQPMTVKPVNVTFDIDRDGGLKISGYIRVSTEPFGYQSALLMYLVASLSTIETCSF